MYRSPAGVRGFGELALRALGRSRGELILLPGVLRDVDFSKVCVVEIKCSSSQQTSSLETVEHQHAVSCKEAGSRRPYSLSRL